MKNEYTALACLGLISGVLIGLVLIVAGMSAKLDQIIELLKVL